ncbi:MAG: 3-dehydroquinate synthase [Planctomycetota bacterium]|nr:3-dehydroquinate synthase [Planctomycetota bacterium]
MSVPPDSPISEKSKTVHVALAERSYDISIGSGNLPSLGAQVAACCRLTHAVVITDSRVESPHGEAAIQSLDATGAEVDALVIEEGEQSKSIDVASALWEKLLDLGTDRKSVIVAVGGGVVGDLAGFVAATFARGLPFFQVPTTLLAQVDSSVGGKTGVNLPGAKNMVGVFWQPRGVLIDTQVLKTQRDRDYRSGLAEVVKYGVILDPEFFAYLEKETAGLIARRHAVLERVIARSCELKAQVVQQDEREETGLRAILNYGHTFGHAIEAVLGYGEILHGEGVAIGMECAARLAQRLGMVDSEFVRRQHRLLVALGLPVTLSGVDHDALLAAMQHDKKVEHGRLRFVLPTRLGHVELVPDVSVDDVRAAMPMG